jgi:hypothetical protein
MTDEATITETVVAAQRSTNRFITIISAYFRRIANNGEKALANEPMNDNELSVPKKKKIAEGNSQPGATDAAAVTKTTANRRPSRRATTAKKQRKPGITKATTTRTEISASPQNEASELIEFSEDTIRLRAYYISERRRRFALPGDAESDWLEAKRQLLAEARH